ncbi:MAG TPA: PH domain-containing protein [Candidatus Angelobacter sp.]|jgi:membrane protein YdbS with pleckstrin-like domain|nr:PH domain-containing protein [Candidatus Angelobacter sp.]
MAEAVELTRISPRFWTARQVLIALCAVPGLLAAIGGGAALAANGQAAAAAIVVVAGVAAVAAVWTIERGRYRTWGYAERDDDLVVSRGLMFRRLTVVPYGRMQLIDVTAGPLARIFGIATVQMHTAAAASDARIPGLEREDAERLRDRLAAIGEARATGL